MPWTRRAPVALAVMTTLASAACAPEAADPPHALIPLPASIELVPADTFRITDSTVVVFDAGDTEAERLGRFLSGLVGNQPATRPAVVADSAAAAARAVASAAGVIRLTRSGADADLGPEGYALDVGRDEVVIRAPHEAGLFYGVQTFRQLLPPVVEYEGALPERLVVSGARVRDLPRYPWRGFMLDVARHFLEVHEVKRFIDLASLYKLNRLHLHLSDDQGWRIEIPGWPRLTEFGGLSEVGGGEGGFYTRDDYSEIVAYAAERHMVVVPEIDMPGHTNAALSSYGELNCDGERTEPFVGIEVGFSALCVGEERVYEFLDDVIREISELTPGPYFHVGGDEVQRLTDEEYETFIERVQGMVRGHGKTMVGWDEIAHAELEEGTIVQIWRPFWDRPAPEDPERAQRVAEAKAAVVASAEAGARLVLSPANRVYLDLKYDSTTALGLTWAGIPSVRDAYDWEPEEVFSELPPSAVLGVEAPLWSETTAKVQDFERMAFPRLAGVAEIAWSSPAGRGWEEYRLRLGAQSARWVALGINFYRSPQVPWEVGTPER